ncbi:uncharacterized protein LOC132557947 [Ylistrum balloti]|uniref:uncharacterized protein LOC132557947 n=1 Tax=Ylistrum balloti TaxID=509963 RepID=UPI002905DD71|nr:uncharacterized protein LOC132557947 [Ylistrum balloti]
MTSTPLPQSATCRDGQRDGLIAGIVVCVVLLMIVCGILIFVLAKQKGWISTRRFNFKIPKFRRPRHANERRNCESSAYQERSPTTDPKSNPIGNMSYEVCPSIKKDRDTGTGSGNNDKDDQTAEKRISTVSGRSYLELIVGPDGSQVYENVENTHAMRNKTDDDNKIHVSKALDNDVYINFGSDFSDENGEIVHEPEVDESDQIYGNVENTNGNVSYPNSNEPGLTDDDGQNYFVLERTNSIVTENYSSNQENAPEMSDYYFVLEPQNETVESGNY